MEIKNLEVCLDEETCFAIYGCGEIGKKFADVLLKKRFHISAIFDKKADENRKVYRNIPIMKCSEYNLCDRTNVVVMICLSDGLEHKRVADELYATGYKYIEFLPLELTFNPKFKDMLINSYNEILLGNVHGIRVYRYDKLREREIQFKNEILQYSEESVIVWVPLELVFTENLNNWEGDKSKLHMSYEYYDKNIYCNEAYKSLFDFFEGKRDDYKPYVDIHTRNTKKFSVNIAKREKQFQLFKREYNNGMDFFIKSAPDAVWNEKGYFNIVGGNHRIMFLLSQGMNQFPLRMNKVDYKAWCKVSRKTRTRIKKLLINNSGLFKCPISHPGFQNLIISDYSVYYSVFRALCERYGNQKIASKDVMDISGQSGFFAREFYRMGAKRVKVLVNTAVDKQAMDDLNILMHSGEIETVLIDNAINWQFHISYVNDFLLNTNDPGQRKKVLELLNYMTNEEMICLVQNEDEIKWILDNSSFEKYSELSHIVRNGECNRIVVFTKRAYE